jgi:cobalt/nickel transport system ATP-binding protein
MSEWILELDEVVYGYPCSPHSALQQISLKVPVGKRCGLMGQNGCGKTTLFLIANGLYRPQAGSVRWQGSPLRYDRSALARLRQQVGLVFQNPEHQLVATTVEEDISYGLYNLGIPEAEIRVRVQAALAQFHLTELAQQPIHNLSLGQKKRVSIADVMVLKPDLLLLDEPTAYLDPRHTTALREQLQAIHADGTTIVLASHDLDFLYRWADWIFVMDRGRLILEGSPDMVFAQREILERLQLGVPNAIELVEAFKTFLDQQDLLQTFSIEELSQQIHQLLVPGTSP